MANRTGQSVKEETRMIRIFWLKIGLLGLLVLGLWPRSPSATALVAPQAGTFRPCTTPEYRQFAFWAGDWDVFETGGKDQVAHVRVDRILGGCVLREQYDATSGHQGQSFTIYDETRKVWHQTWVTNRGQLLLIEGGLRNGEMVLDGTDRTADGKERRVHAIWKPADSGVRETAVTSTDGGKTWTPWFDLIFRPAAK
jgi:hypothetical protein